MMETEMSIIAIGLNHGQGVHFIIDHGQLIIDHGQGVDPIIDQGFVPAQDQGGQMTVATNASTWMFPSTPGQSSALSLMPYQAMTQATRHARRVYVGGLSATANEQSVAAFFNQVMAAIGGNTAGPGDAVVNVYVNHERMFAFVDMRSVEEASNAMALDGIIFEGEPVRVRWPTDYNPSLAATLGLGQANPNLNLAAVGLTVLDGLDCIFVGGVPQFLTEGRIRELLEMFGPLRGFNLVKDRKTGNSKGYAFCVYQDLMVTDIACAALSSIKMGDKTLILRRANQGLAQARPEQEDVLPQAQQQVALQKLAYQMVPLPTKVVCLTQVVSADELENDEEYEDIVEDMRSEGEKYGKLVNVIIPRPGPNGEPSPGVGKVFLEYADTEGSTKARQGCMEGNLGGKKLLVSFIQRASLLKENMMANCSFLFSVYFFSSLIHRLSETLSRVFRRLRCNSSCAMAVEFMYDGRKYDIEACQNV